MRARSPRASAGALVVAAAVAVGGVGTSLAAEYQRDARAEADIRAAQRLHPTILSRYGGLYPDRRLARYVDAVGQALVRTQPGVWCDFHFTVLDSPGTFAFAHAGCYIYISRGMVALANSEDELAAVLAHEIAHVLARHGAARDEMHRRTDPRDAAALELIFAFTREQEMEADAMSIPILLAAGYDPFAQGRFLRVVERHDVVNVAEGIDGPPRDSGDTHPPIADRVDLVVETAVELLDVHPVQYAAPAGYLAYSSRSVALGTPSRPGYDPDEFHRSIDGMVYGRRPSDGLVIGGSYVNTRYRIAFELPPGFHFTYARRNVRAEGPGGATMRMDSYTSRRRPFNSDLIAYLGRNSGGRLAAAHTLEINGLPAAFGRVPLRNSDGAELFLAVVQVSARTLYRFSFYIPASYADTMSERIWESARSFQRLTRGEIHAAKPLRLEVVTVEEGTTLESLAARMRMLQHPMAWLLMLNQLEPGAELMPGDRLKIVQHN